MVCQTCFLVCGSNENVNVSYKPVRKVMAGAAQRCVCISLDTKFLIIFVRIKLTVDSAPFIVRILCIISSITYPGDSLRQRERLAESSNYFGLLSDPGLGVEASEAQTFGC